MCGNRPRFAKFCTSAREVYTGIALKMHFREAVTVQLTVHQWGNALEEHTAGNAGAPSPTQSDDCPAALAASAPAPMSACKE